MIYAYACLSVCLSLLAYLSVYLPASFCLPTCLAVSASLAFFLSVSACLPACLRVCLYVSLSSNLRPSFLSRLSVCVSLSVCVCLFVCLSASVSLNSYYDLSLQLFCSRLFLLLLLFVVFCPRAGCKKSIVLIPLIKLKNRSFVFCLSVCLSVSLSLSPLSCSCFPALTFSARTTMVTSRYEDRYHGLNSVSPDLKQRRMVRRR